MANKQFDFIKNFRFFFCITLAILTIGLVINFIFGTKLDINFKGGTVITYSYTGNLDENAVEKVVQDKTKQDLSISTSEDMSTKAKTFTLSFSNDKPITADDQKAITTELTAKFKDSKISQVNFNSVGPSVGSVFFQKSLYVIFLAGFFVVIYVAFRFRKIGGISAGVTGMVALVHDIIMVYFVYVIFRFPLDDNFIAVVLTILGYSLNDTIVIYDRMRENRDSFGSKYSTRDLVNMSVNQSLKRSVITALMTFISITVVYVVALIRGLDTIITFALPMSIGILFGAYSTFFIATPLWVFWQDFKDKRALKKKKA